MKRNDFNFIEPDFNSELDALVVKTSDKVFITIPENYDEVKNLGKVWRTDEFNIQVMNNGSWESIDFDGEEYKIVISVVANFINYRYSKHNTFAKLEELDKKSKKHFTVKIKEFGRDNVLTTEYVGNATTSVEFVKNFFGVYNSDVDWYEIEEK